MRISRMLPITIIILILLAVLTQCATLSQMTEIRKPQVEVAAVDVEALNFEGARLRFDLEVSNPNPVAIHLSGFDYSLEMDNRPFLQGSQTQGIDITANGSSRVQVPTEFRFDDLQVHLQNLGNGDETPYTMTVTLFFDLPLLGKASIPVQSSGTIPVIRLPRISLAALRLERLSLSQADLLLILEIDNPNGFSLLLASMAYDFSVNQREWARGILQIPAEVPPHTGRRIDLPLKLDLAALGGTVRRLLLGESRLDYDFNANLGLGTSLPLLTEMLLPLRLSGEITLTR